MPSVPPETITPRGDLLYFASSIGPTNSRPIETTDAPTMVVAAKEDGDERRRDRHAAALAAGGRQRLSNRRPATPD